MASNDPFDPRLNWAALSQAERDAAYDNNKAVANSPALIAARNEASEKFRAAHATALDIALRKTRTNEDRYYPARDKLAPCLVFIHGGYWQRNSREVLPFWSEEWPRTDGRSPSPAIHWRRRRRRLKSLRRFRSHSIGSRPTAHRTVSPAPWSCPDGPRALISPHSGFRIPS